MLTLNDIINISFRKSNFSGYKTEDVDNFIDQVKESYEALIKKTIDQKEENEKKEDEKQQISKKVEMMVARLEEYRQEEDEIKNALVSAQKLGDASIREARHKAEIIIKDATLKADRILAGAKADLTDQKEELERLKKTASEFRSRLLDTYKQHLTLINAIPTYRSERHTASKPLQEEEPLDVQNLEEPDILTRESATAQVADCPEDFHVSVANFDEEPDEETEFDANGLDGNYYDTQDEESVSSFDV